MKKSISFNSDCKMLALNTKSQAASLNVRSRGIVKLQKSLQKNRKQERSMKIEKKKKYKTQLLV